MEQIIYIKMDLALNNLQRLICHKTHQTNQPIYYISERLQIDKGNQLFGDMSIILLRDWKRLSLILDTDLYQDTSAQTGRKLAARKEKKTEVGIRN